MPAVEPKAALFTPWIELMGEDVVVIHFGEKADDDLPILIEQVKRSLVSQWGLAIQEAIPAYTTLTLVYRLTLVNFATPAAQNQLLKNVQQTLKLWDEGEGLNREKAADRVHVIPVCYEAAFAPDLHALANQLGMTPEAIVETHCSVTYTVFATGFAPGFPYLGWVDESIAVPRLKNPRLKVRAGSVGIADRQTGIYPFESPGGWNIIGCTSFELFDLQKSPPNTLSVGDTVRFEPIRREQMQTLEKEKND